MAFDPTKPANNSPVSSAELREQLTSLKTEIDDRVVLSELDNIMIGFNAGRVPPEVLPLGMTVSNPPTQAQVQAIANKIDEMLVFLKRE